MATAVPQVKADVTVRRLLADDHDAVRRLHERLDEHDRYMRFFAVRPAHLAELAESLCRQDPAHYALGAFVGDTLVGVANYVSLDADVDAAPSVVEFALVVDHAYRMHGVGTALLTRLVQHATACGIEEMRAEVLTENASVLALIRDQGWGSALRRDGAEMHLDIAVGES
ncbi:GNAT family N-acetyltransferase [Rhodococcus sp. USK13]|uniref:GNAT family N-acetyltransferase n=1 Tax=Rhodococcus sp. USK13 TaxID=2806442 RepID=UPI001BCCDD7E|nr:GNAT family N-acetyltransferase [Rhodococcus sp. USK13]